MVLDQLSTGDILIATLSGQRFQVEKVLGKGGQGEVYRAQVNGQPMALKWYFRENATDRQRSVLENLITVGAPSDDFLWPLELATSSEHPTLWVLDEAPRCPL